MSTQETRTRIVWDYAPAPESLDHLRLRDPYGLFVNGEFVDPKDGTRAERHPSPRSRPRSRSPGPTTCAAPPPPGRGPTRAALSGLERGKYLFRVARLIQERARELAVAESMDGGKPIRESRDVDVPLAAAHSSTTRRWTSSTGWPAARRRRRVAAQIVPWNFPPWLRRSLAPALACGNTAALKPPRPRR